MILHLQKFSGSAILTSEARISIMLLSCPSSETRWMSEAGSSIMLLALFDCVGRFFWNVRLLPLDIQSSKRVIDVLVQFLKEYFADHKKRSSFAK